MAEEKKDWALSEEEMDYDALLSHYKDAAKPEPPPPPREKKKVISTLLSDVSAPGEGKFARKRGSRSQKEKEPEEAPPLELEGLKPPRPQEGKKRWERILREPVGAPPAAEPAPELSQVMDSLEEPPREDPAPEPPKRKKRGAAQAKAAPVPAPEPEGPESPVPGEEPPKGAPAPRKGRKEKPPKAEKRPREKAPALDPAPIAEPVPPRDWEPSALEWIYIEVYYIGIQLLRDLHLFRREAAKLRDWLWEQAPLWFEEQRRRFLRVCNHISDTTLFPYRELARLTSRLYHQVKEAGRGKGSFKVKLGCWWNYFRSLARPLNHIANFVAPIIGITILAATLTYFQGIHYALSVEYSGRHLGYVAHESDFYEAQQMVLDRMLNEEYQAADNNQPVFRIVIADEEDLTDTETLANRLIATSQNDVEEADGVYIEGAFLGALKDGSEFLIYLDSILEDYRTGIDHELVQFVKSITVRRGIYPTSSVMPLYRITQEMESDRTRIIEHRVEEGETLPQIAESYGTTVEDLIELNSMLAEREAQASEETGEIDPATVSLITGERLTVARVTMDLGVQVTRREVYTEDIPYSTINVEDKRYYKGYQVPISAGVNGKQEVTADVTYIDGEQVGETRIGTPVVLQEPVSARMLVGTMPILTYLPGGGNSSESFMWPVKGGRVSAGLYGYRGHTGMDIAAPYGTEIRAAMDGQVTYATNYSIWPYGKRVDMSHGNGVTTRYAHCSSVFVTAGQYVRQGDTIALVGRTGNASGNHLHFEIRINGAIMNPANYIGNYWPGY